MEEQSNKSAASRSTFVTVLAWVFIVITGFMTFISLLQNVMINTMVPFENMPSPSGPGVEKMPAAFEFIFGNIHLVFLTFFVISAATLISAIGLLRRKNWARKVFIGILGLGIVWNIGGIIFQQMVFSSMPPLPSDAPDGFNQMATIMFVFSAVMAAGISLLFAWLIKRLLSASIRAEFGI